MAGESGLVESLARLSLSQLNSVMMEVFARQALNRTPADLVAAYRENRFVGPSLVDPKNFCKHDLQLMSAAVSRGFSCLELSPLAPFASCSYAGIHQNRIVSALRGTEVCADATNVLALEAAVRRLESPGSDVPLHLAASHRHVRAQAITGKGFTAHFRVFCALSAGKDTGHFQFEKDAVVRHFGVYKEYLNALGVFDGLEVVIKSLKGNGENNPVADAVQSAIGELSDNFLSVSRTSADPKEHAYYNGVRFSVLGRWKGRPVDIGDGGFVSWGARLTGSRKERMLTSGLGTEFIQKLLSGAA